MTKIYHECNYLQGQEGNIDPTHASYLHRRFSRRSTVTRQIQGTELSPQQLYSADAAPSIEVEETATILQKANALVGLGLKAKDALHIACAIAGGCAYFLTTDDDILKRGRDVQGITLLDPTAFVREMNL